MAEGGGGPPHVPAAKNLVVGIVAEGRRGNPRPHRSDIGDFHRCVRRGAGVSPPSRPRERWWLASFRRGGGLTPVPSARKLVTAINAEGDGG